MEDLKIMTKTINEKHRIYLAPMDGYTDSALRELFALYAKVKSDILFTEFVNVEALKRTVRNAQRIIHLTENQRPVVAQLFGKNPDAFYEATKKIISEGFDGVDINMGCPAKKIATKTEGAGLINHPELAERIVLACRRAIDETGIKKQRNFTFSVKTRLGFNEDTANDWLSGLDKYDFDFITLHGRTFKQMYGGKANWERIGEIAKLIKTPLIGNGDITTIEEAHEKQEKYGLHGTMLGRNGQIMLGDDANERVKLTAKYLELHKELQSEFYKTPEFAFAATKKVVLWLLKGIEDSNELKQQVIRMETYEEAINAVNSYVL